MMYVCLISVTCINIAQAEESKLPVKIKEIKPLSRDIYLVKAIYDDLLFNGKGKESYKGGRRFISITWENAIKNKQKHPLDKAVKSSIEVHPEYGLEIGDSVILKGDLEASGIGITSKATDIKNQIHSISANMENDSEEIFSPGTVDHSSPTSTLSGSSSEESVKEIEPNVNLESSETEEGCNIRIDTGSELAYVQKKEIKGGEEVTGCQDSSEYFMLLKDYEGCRNYINYSNKELYKQYRYYYVRNDSRITLDSCYKDSSTRMKIEEEYNSCKLEHKSGYSLASRKLYYIGDNNKRIYLTDCQANQDKSYKHEFTYDGCSAKKINDVVTPYHRKYINQDGTNIYLSECVPTQEKASVSWEFCSSKFVHDVGTSYYSKSFYFMRGGVEKVYLDRCKVSSESAIHLKETTGCNIVNDDISKSSTRFYKTYIKDKYDNNNKIEISDCQASNTPTPYSRIDDEWRHISSMRNQPIIINNLNHGRFLGSEWVVQKTSSSPLREMFVKSFDISKANFQQLCWNSGASSVWKTSHGHSIDVSNSNSMPSYASSYTALPASAGLTAYTGFMRTESRPQTNYYASCHSAKCSISLLRRYPKYKRGDGSTYVDESTILEEKRVCGTGDSLLN